MFAHVLEEGMGSLAGWLAGWLGKEDVRLYQQISKSARRCETGNSDFKNASTVPSSPHFFSIMHLSKAKTGEHKHYPRQQHRRRATTCMDLTAVKQWGRDKCHRCFFRTCNCLHTHSKALTTFTSREDHNCDRAGETVLSRC